MQERPAIDYLGSAGAYSVRFPGSAAIYTAANKRAVQRYLETRRAARGIPPKYHTPEAAGLRAMRGLSTGAVDRVSAFVSLYTKSALCPCCGQPDKKRRELKPEGRERLKIRRATRERQAAERRAAEYAGVRLCKLPV